MADELIQNEINSLNPAVKGKVQSHILGWDGMVSFNGQQGSD